MCVTCQHKVRVLETLEGKPFRHIDPIHYRCHQCENGVPALFRDRDIIPTEIRPYNPKTAAFPSGF